MRRFRIAAFAGRDDVARQIPIVRRSDKAHWNILTDIRTRRRAAASFIRQCFYVKLQIEIAFGELSAVSIISTLICKLPPRVVIRPVTIVCTPSVLAISLTLIELPLYLKLELRAMAFSCDSCDNLLINASVKPSDRYSLSAFPVSLTNGRTAIDLMWFSVVRCR